METNYSTRISGSSGDVTSPQPITILAKGRGGSIELVSGTFNVRTQNDAPTDSTIFTCGTSKIYVQGTADIIWSSTLIWPRSEAILHAFDGVIAHGNDGTTVAHSGSMVYTGRTIQALAGSVAWGQQGDVVHPEFGATLFAEGGTRVVTADVDFTVPEGDLLVISTGRTLTFVQAGETFIAGANDTFVVEPGGHAIAQEGSIGFVKARGTAEAQKGSRLCVKAAEDDNDLEERASVTAAAGAIILSESYTFVNADADATYVRMNGRGKRCRRR